VAHRNDVRAEGTDAPLGTKGAAPGTQECRLEAGATKKPVSALWAHPQIRRVRHPAEDRRYV